MCGICIRTEKNVSEQWTLDLGQSFHCKGIEQGEAFLQMVWRHLASRVKQKFDSKWKTKRKYFILIIRGYTQKFNEQEAFLNIRKILTMQENMDN
jgi:hypothetical protein